jgi:HD-like signal output (HDOD) protein
MLNVVPLPEPKVAPAPESEALKRKALQALAGLPPFSAILNRLISTLAGEDVSFSKLGDLIEKDTVVAGNLLKMVNSALYGRVGTINSVRHALSILGLTKLRNAVLGMSLTRMWNKAPVPKSWSMAQFNMHSAAVALLSDLLAQRLPVNYPEGAFVAGLLHDLGRLLIATGLSDQHALILEKHAEIGGSHLEAEREILGFTHSELSADALWVWNLPEPIRLAVLHHHDGTLQTDPREIPLSRLIECANNYVNSIGVWIIPETADCADATLIQTLGLKEERLASILVEFKAEYDVMLQFFH